MIEMKVRNLMTEHVFSATPDDTLLLVRDLMWEENIRHVPVVDADRELVGLVSHRDLLRVNSGVEGTPPGANRPFRLQRTLVRDAMNAGVETTDPDTDIREAARTMVENKYGCLPVVSGGRLVGILTEADFVKLLAGDGN